ncbi:MAG TPA: hypothetical protein DIU00_13435 [Phycisphaerales bacterium]|nr:hypothetical protein [Phycisphaerales bacterium]
MAKIDSIMSMERAGIKQIADDIKDLEDGLAGWDDCIFLPSAFLDKQKYSNFSLDMLYSSVEMATIPGPTFNRRLYSYD